MSERKKRILTSIPGVTGRFWGDNTYLISEKSGELMYGNHGFFAKHLIALVLAIKMLVRARDFDAVVVDGGPVGQWYSWLAAIVPFPRPPALMVDCLWYREKHRLKRIVKVALRKLSARSITKFAVWAQHEVSDYAYEFGIPIERFIYIPFHITLEDYVFETSDKGYVFAGGNGDRDYRTLVEAVRGLDTKVFIAATDKSLFEGIDLPKNVVVKGVSHEEFRHKMAQSSMVVVPMQAGLLHSGGQQTFLNSMYMGKPTIVVGQRVADGYIQDGINGMVVDYGDVDGLRKAIDKLNKNPQLLAEIGKSGQLYASQLTTDAFVRRLYSLALDLTPKDQ